MAAVSDRAGTQSSDPEWPDSPLSSVLVVVVVESSVVVLVESSPVVVVDEVSSVVVEDVELVSRVVELVELVELSSSVVVVEGGAS